MALLLPVQFNLRQQNPRRKNQLNEKKNEKREEKWSEQPISIF